MLGEEYLPKGPIAVGEYQAVQELDQLKYLLPEFGTDSTFHKPLLMTLSAVQKVEGKSIGLLRDTTSLTMKVPVPGAAPIDLTLKMEIALAYDLEKQAMRQTLTKATGSGFAKVEDRFVDIRWSHESTVEEKPQK